MSEKYAHKIYISIVDRLIGPPKGPAERFKESDLETLQDICLSRGADFDGDWPYLNDKQYEKVKSLGYKID